jgi:hypothetical protein
MTGHTPRIAPIIEVIPRPFQVLPTPLIERTFVVILHDGTVRNLTIMRYEKTPEILDLLASSPTVDASLPMVNSRPTLDVVFEGYEDPERPTPYCIFGTETMSDSLGVLVVDGQSPHTFTSFSPTLWRALGLVVVTLTYQKLTSGTHPCPINSSVLVHIGTENKATICIANNGTDWLSRTKKAIEQAGWAVTVGND